MENLTYQPWVCLTPVNLMKLLKQRKLWLAWAVAVPCGILGAALKYYVKEVESERFKGVIQNTAFYNMLTFWVGFLAAFRIRAAYNKFWEGCDHAYSIVGDLFDAASTLCSFMRQSTASQEDQDNFFRLLVRLLSLLNSTIFAELEQGANRKTLTDGGATATAFSFELIDIKGIDADSIDQLILAENKPETVFQWINNLIIDSVHKGIFSPPAPLISWGLSDLQHAISEFHKSQKITEIPFPFPYMIALQLLLITHWMATLMVVIEWSNYIWAAGVCCFLSTFSLWFFVGLAMELDVPFGHTQNSVDVRYLQKLLNHRLVTLKYAIEMGPPKLSSQVRRDLSVSSYAAGSDEEVSASFSKTVARRTQAGS